MHPAPDWQRTEEARRIERSFRFRNFRQALTFLQESLQKKRATRVYQIAHIAEFILH